MDLNVYIQLIFLWVVNIIFTFSGIIFEHIGDIMPLHDHGVVVFRFGLGPNDVSRNIALSCVLVNRGL